MILAALLWILDVSSDCSARPDKLFSDFVYGELSCVQNVDCSMRMLRQIGF